MIPFSDEIEKIKERQCDKKTAERQDRPERGRASLPHQDHPCHMDAVDSISFNNPDVSAVLACSNCCVISRSC